MPFSRQIPKAFNSEQTASMTRALLRAFAEIASRGPMTLQGEAAAKSALARGIVAAAEAGELDEERLAASALAFHTSTREAATPDRGPLTPA